MIGSFRQLGLLFFIIGLSLLVGAKQSNKNEQLFRVKEQFMKVLNKATKDAALMLEGKLTTLEKDLEKATASSRRKRSNLEKSELVLLKSLDETARLLSPSDLADVAFVQTSKYAYLIGAAIKDTRRPEKALCPIWIWNAELKQFQILATVPVINAVSVEAFVINDEAYFTFALNTRKDFKDIVIRNSKIYKIIDNVKIVTTQVNPTVGATQWKSFTVDGQTFLASGSYLELRPPRDSKDFSRSIPKASSNVTIYRWTGLAFTRFQTIPASHTTKMDFVSIHNRHFLAVVNQTFLENYVESTLLIYEIVPHFKGEKKLSLFQKIIGWAIGDIKFIRTRKELYLAIAYEFRVHNSIKIYEVHSMIYRFNGLFFVQYQHIPTSCALQWTLIYGSANELALHLLSRDKEHMFALIEDSWVEIPLPFTFGSVALKSFKHIPEGPSHLAIIRLKELQIVIPKFVHRETEDKSAEILAMCNNLKERLRNLGVQRARLEKSESQVASRNGSQTLYGRKTFVNVRIKTLNVNRAHLRRTSVFKSLVKKRINDLKGIVETLPQNMSDYLLLTESQNLENSNLVVGDASLDRASAQLAHFQNINGRGPLCDLMNKTVWFHSEATTIMSNKWLTFEKVVFADALNVSGVLNGLRVPDNVAFLDRHNYFTAPKYFKHGMEIKQRLQLVGSVNGIEPSNLLLTVGDQTVAGNVIFDADIDARTVEQKIQDSRVNGVPWSWFKNEVVLTDRKEVLKGAKIFRQNIVIQGDFTPEKYVAGVNIQKMCKSTIPLVGSQRINRKVILRDIKLVQDLNVNGPINNIRFPDHLVRFSDPVWDVNLNLTNTTRIQKLKVEGLINGFNIQEDLLTKTRPQIITGLKTFNNLDVYIDLEILGLLNGQNLTQIIQNFRPKVLSTLDHYESLKVRELKISGQVHANLQKVLKDAVLINKPHNFPGLVEFKNSVNFLNNLVASPNIFGELVAAMSPEQLILPGSTFGDLVFLRGFFLDKTINGINLKSLVYNILLQEGEQIITAPKMFLSDINIEQQLLVHGLVNGINLNDLAKINEDTIISADVIFTVPPTLARTATVHNLLINGSINGMDVNKWLEDSLLTNANQRILEEKTFLNGLTIGDGPEKSNVLVKGNVYLGEMDLFQLLRDLVLTNRSDVIDAPTIFDAMVSIHKLTADSVNGVNIDDLFTSALHKDDSRCIIFLDAVGIEHVGTPQINNITIDDFFTKVLLINDDVFSGALHFSKLISQGSVKMEGLLNGKKFGDDVVRKSSRKNIITAPKEFIAPLTTSNIQLQGHINNIDVKLLDQSLVKQGLPQLINGTIEAGTVLIKGNLKVKGPIQGIHLQHFYKRAMQTDKPSIVSRKIFETVIHNPLSARNFEVENMIDNINLTYIKEKAVTVDTEQNLGQLTFLNNVVFNNVQMRDLQITDGSYLNNIKVDAWAMAIMKRTGKQIITGRNVFNVVNLRGLELLGEINKTPLKDILLTTGGKVDDPKTFEHVVTDYLKVGGLLMSENLTRFLEDSVFLDKPKPEIIMSPKSFINVEVKNDVEFKSYIDGIKTSSIMTTRGNQDIKGKKTFTNSVNSPRWLDVNLLQGSINNSPHPMQEIIRILMTVPLPYPCTNNFIYYKGSCFLFIPYLGELDRNPEEICINKKASLVQNIPVSFYQELGLILKNHEWFIQHSNFKVISCATSAHLDIKIPLELNGKFTFQNVMREANNSKIISEAEEKFDSAAHMFNWQKNGITEKLNSVMYNLENVCSSTEQVKYALTNAYRPFGDFIFVQQLSQNYIKTYALPPQITDSTMAFLALQINILDFYTYTGNNFILSKSIPISPVLNLVKIDNDNFIDSNGNFIIVLPTSANCQLGTIGQITIWKITVTVGPTPSITVVETDEVGVECLSPSAVDILQIQKKTILVKANDADIEVHQWNEELEKFEDFLSIPGALPLQFIKGVGKRGHILVIRSGSGNSDLEVIKINMETIAATSILKTYESKYISKIFTFMVANEPYVILVENARIRLLRLDRRSLTTVQVLESGSCVTNFILAPSKGLVYVVVSTMTTTDYYIFKGYLQYYKGLNVPTEEVVILNGQHEIMQIAKVKHASESRITVFKSIQKGPLAHFKCNRKC